MADITVTIPYDGVFTQDPVTLNTTNDVLQLTLNRFVVFIQQINQAIGYIGVYDFDDYINADTYQVMSQRAFFYNNCSGARLHKLSDTTFLLIKDRGAHVFTVNIQGEAEIVYTNNTYFANGNTGLANQSERSHRQYVNLYNFQNNTLHGIEAIDNSGPQVGNHRYIKLEWDPVLEDLTRTELYNLNDAENNERMSFSFVASINTVPASNKYFLSFSTSNNPSNPGETQELLNIAAYLNDDLTFDQEVSIPTSVDFTPVHAVAMDENRIIFHQQAGSTNAARVMVNLDDENAINPFIADVSGTFNFETSRVIRDIIPLDRNHYFIIYNANGIVIKTRGDELFDAVNGFNIGYTIKKNSFVKVNDDLYTIFTGVGVLGNPTRLRFGLARVYQPSV